MKPATLEPLRLDNRLDFSALATLVGVGLTTFGAASLTAIAMAPGAALALFGGGWLGNSLARRAPLRRDS